MKKIAFVLSLLMFIVGAISCSGSGKRPVEQTTIESETEEFVFTPTLILDLVSPGSSDEGIRLWVDDLEELNTIHAEIVNDSDQEVTYGEEFSLQVYTDDQWRELVPEDTIWKMIAFILEPGESVHRTYVLPQDGFTFDSGKYKLTIPSLNVSTEFTLVWTE